MLEDVNNHDRWMVSYADFITLLFAFFVVMYSVSSVNEGKYKSLTHSLGTAFSNKDNQESVLDPVQIETPFTAVQPMIWDTPAITFEKIPLDPPALTFKPALLDKQTTVEVEERRELSEEILKERRQLNQVSDQLEEDSGIFY